MDKIKTEIKRLPKSRVKFKVILPSKLLEDYFNQAFSELKKDIEIKGFRKGQGPKNMMMEKIGLERMLKDTLDKALSESYYQAIGDHKLRPVSQPKISVSKYHLKEAGGKENELEYEAEVDVMPEVRVGDYKSLKLKTKNAKLNEDKIKKDIQKILEALKKQHQDKYLEKTNFKTEEELIKAIEGMVHGQEELKQKNARLDELIDEVLKITEVDIPESLIENEISGLEKNLNVHLEATKKKMDDFLREQKTTLEDLRKKWRTLAERSLKTQFALIEIAKQEKMDLKDPMVIRKVLDKLLEH